MMIYKNQSSGSSKIHPSEVSSEMQGGNRKKRVKNGKKRVKNGYKSRTKRSPRVNHPKVIGGGRSRKSKPRKNLTKKNKLFLEKIGLKVKQNSEN